MSSKTQSVATLAGLLIGLIALIAAVGVTRCGHGPPRMGLAAGPARGWCKAPADAAWKRALAGGLVALSRRASVVSWALAGDGRTFFASVYSRRISGVVRVDAASSAVTVIKRFADPRTDQADGSFDGRWLVWDEYHSLFGSDDFTTWS